MTKVTDYLMWLMFGVSLIISLLTMLVLFGTGIYIEVFSTFLPLEASLSASFILWGINSLINPYTRNSKYTCIYAFIFSAGLIAFALMGIY
jgi:hypothetical protein